MKKRLTKDKIMNMSTYTLVTVAFVILQLLMSQGKLSSTMKGFLVPACAYIVLAISLNLLVGICGELSLGHAGFMGIGAFTGVIVTALLSTAVPNGIMRLVIAMVVGGVMAGAIGFLIGIPVLRLKGDYLAIVTLAFGYILTQVGYSNIWPLFGSANQLLSALVLITLCVFLRVTGRENRTLLVPLVVMLCVTFTALVERCIALVKAYNAGTAVFMVEGLQLIIAVLLMVLGVIIVVHSGKVLFSKSTASKTENDKRSEMNKPAHC